ncbi:hypothetical protein B0J17DRAFT_721989 [Rhizoctonia solani]|nr:hypothetical protein B0J17DRAFT_721989 [Rhizoctonia solani]
MLDVLRQPPSSRLEPQQPTHTGYTEAQGISYGLMQLPTPALIKCQILEPHEFDELGEELGRDPQVHKTYVRETNRVDLELVDGWNGTVDVVLIFVSKIWKAKSTLFSAIITPPHLRPVNMIIGWLVIETMKRLRQDPIDISAKVPSITYQDQRFTTGAPDSRLIVVINALWCLSLSLSVAVSFIAMLSKEWFFQFMSGRVGSSATQARRRQQR